MDYQNIFSDDDGQNQDQYTDPGYPNGRGPRKKSKLPFIIIAVVLIAALVTGGVLFLLNKQTVQQPARQPKQQGVYAGGIISLGHYPQTASGTDSTPIEWLVLDVQGNSALVISRYGLDAMTYYYERESITWEDSALRSWLNGSFINAAFSVSEQNAILTTTVDNGYSQNYSGWNAAYGNNTQDRIFVLSYAEANRYLGLSTNKNTNTRVQATQYAVSRGANQSGAFPTSEGGASAWWWLRSDGGLERTAATVLCDGSLSRASVGGALGCVRPAMWVNTDSIS